MPLLLKCLCMKLLWPLTLCYLRSSFQSCLILVSSLGGNNSPSRHVTQESSRRSWPPLFFFFICTAPHYEPLFCRRREWCWWMWDQTVLTELRFHCSGKPACCVGDFLFAPMLIVSVYQDLGFFSFTFHIWKGTLLSSRVLQRLTVTTIKESHSSCARHIWNYCQSGT